MTTTQNSQKVPAASCHSVSQVVVFAARETVAEGALSDFNPKN